MKEDILRQIGSIARAYDAIANIEFKEVRLNRGQYLLLTRIGENPGVISDHLADILNVDRTTVARGVKKLVEQKMAEKVADQSNKKIKHLFLTAEGQKLMTVIERENIYSNKTVLAGLTRTEQDELARLLKKMEENASKDWHLVKNGGKREY